MDGELKHLKRFVDHFEWSLKEWNPTNGPLVTITRTQSVNLIKCMKELIDFKEKKLDIVPND